MISANVICKSISPKGITLTTFKLRYPRFIHAEFMTHRVVSRNASSSRAVPTAKLIEEVRSDSLRAAPVWWGKNQPGMQAPEELSDQLESGHPIGVLAISGRVVFAENSSAKGQAQELWKGAALAAADEAEALLKLGAHKQIVNRILEPFTHINVVASATDWDNFFGLRLHADAQPEMRVLAECMWASTQETDAIPLNPGEWHLPYVTADDALFAVRNYREGGLIAMDPDELLRRVSAARCARTSYISFETGKASTPEEDMALFGKLAAAAPLHASPLEHQATPDEWGPNRGARGFCTATGWRWPEHHGNFRGWCQFRKTIPGEACAPLPAKYLVE